MTLLRKPDRHVVIVTGSEEWTDRQAMSVRLSRYPSGTLVIHGGARGADTMADKIALDLDFRVLKELYFGDLGKLGGPKRNELLVDLGCTYQRHGYIVTIEAFPTPGCSGTWDCVRRGRDAELQVEVRHGGPIDVR